jgi:hypothetical protein
MINSWQQDAAENREKRFDGRAASPYIGGGPHLPNEVLSFWKE